MAKKVHRLTDNERAQLRNDADRAAALASAKLFVIGREQVVDDLEGFRQVSMLDFFNQSEHTGRLMLKPLEELRLLPRHHQRWLKKIRIKDEIDGQTISIEGLDTLNILEKAGKYLKMWDGDGSPKHIHLHGEMQRLANMTPDELADLRAQTEQELREVQAE